ncbi:SRPBCC domain-containing protein [Aliiroseovarius sp. F47248L]|uniref:SRPBCC domain-containing protein n=1 Tax=Aliiroseovarius sp. F47248L TaxID=2926420 RepID=UPI001FF662FF|nr:SRPBCC domain-containing protein [Aliiroseovarius sp. F47248L]MCK0139816.1 SRPBCC domain-containing protein [Aliiroseovarius sp. F47248L]
MEITIETTINAPIESVWTAWTTPETIVQWNAASEDWHTTTSRVDLCVGGEFSSRMEAKDGSMGFDFAGIYTRIEKPNLLEAEFGGRMLRVEFSEEYGKTTVRETFEPEDMNSIDMQRAGWQAILDNFKRFVEAK